MTCCLPVTILDICTQLDQLNDDGVIFASRVDGEFLPGSEASVLTLLPAERQMPARDVAAWRCPGMEYCLEVSIAKDAIAVWSRWRDGAEPTSAERAEAVCYKANNDAWGPQNFPV